MRQADFVVNTPYKLYFSFSEENVEIPDYFDQKQLSAIFPVVHKPDPAAKPCRRNDFDGTWAVWDEEFLQFTCLNMAEVPQPFLAGVFTASSHHPYAIPDKHKDTFSHGSDVENCARYTDHSLRRFFATARCQPWFDNTIFVITADHTNTVFAKGRKRMRLSRFSVPLFIYDPQDGNPAAHEGIMQDSRMKNDLSDSIPELARHMEKRIKAFMQNYKNLCR